MQKSEPEDDSEKTVTGPSPAARAETRAAHPVTGIDAERRRGDAAASALGGHVLPLGTRLRDYEITGLVGEGGFGIVYLAWDHSLQRRIAIKEYMPASMASRVAGASSIVVKSERHLDTFRAGLKSFVNEARLLARFDHPSLLKVYRFWEENGTAYMAMPYYEGPTLKAALAARGGPLDEASLRAWLAPLLDALELMHDAHCFHRDIAPDNILLTPRGPLLLDFGAARRVIGDMTHAITVVLKPGYAPIEQYGDVAAMAQGAWTDLYALGSVVYAAIVGKTPTSSVERLLDDRLPRLAVVAAGRYSDALLRAVDAALAVRPHERPQSVTQFRALLGDSNGASLGDGSRGRGEPTTIADGARQSNAALRTTSTERGQARPERVPPQPRPSNDALASTPLRSRRLIVGATIAALGIALAVIVIRALQPAPRSADARRVEQAAPVTRTTSPASDTTASTARPAITTTPTSPPLDAPAAQAPIAPAAAAASMQASERATSPITSARAHESKTTAAAPARITTTAKPRMLAVASRSSRCSDLLQKASLEPLSASDAAFLNRECR